jgi:hypothetical protein
MVDLQSQTLPKYIFYIIIIFMIVVIFLAELKKIKI